jgi:hypothetical protein
MADFEKLGVFYLGRVLDATSARPTGDLLLYDSKDLTTHAACVGMTGSGKTGLCLALLEEAAIDGIPAICIDPKGDLSNLLLTFPGLSAQEFRPWIDEAEAEAAGRTPDEQAAFVAKLWRDGLAGWGEDGERIERLRRAADFAIFTPGSSAGLPLSVMRSFAAPPPQVLADADALRERVVATTSGLLALAGIEGDALRSREHVLLSNILDAAWRQGRGLDLASIIAAIRTPPFERVGVLDLEAFYPAKERFELAMALNNLVAAPGFSAWLEGEPLDVARLLRAPDGRPRVSIVSIAHLSDAERMFFVTLLLQEIVAWMRAQPGTGSLRAIVYMDEVFGYLPPVANPPSKLPMLTLLKQARAFGVGLVLATQNPVDLDYKALSNAGTWFLGRLQTERDKARVMDGLEGASAAAGRSFDRQRMEALLGGLSKRRFVMVSAHEDEPVLFESRWALSYLRGPMTRPQIQQLMASRKQASAAPAPAPSSDATPPRAADASATTRPVLAPGVSEVFLARRAGAATPSVTYRAKLLARARLHHVSAKEEVDAWRDVALLAEMPEQGEPSWGDATSLDAATLAVLSIPEAGASFLAPKVSLAEKTLQAWGRGLATHLLASAPLRLLRCAELRATSQPGESEADFRGRLAHEARERRDQAVDKVRQQNAARMQQLDGRLRAAEQRVSRERDQATQASTQAGISIGATVLGALFGRRSFGVSSLGRATTAARGASRAIRAREDIARAQDGLQSLQEEVARLEAEVEEQVRVIEASLDVTRLALDPLDIPPRKGDIVIAQLALCWAPWVAGADGVEGPAW